LWGDEDEVKVYKTVCLSEHYPSIRVDRSSKQDIIDKLEDGAQTNSEIFRYAIKILIPEANIWSALVTDPDNGKSRNVTGSDILEKYKNEYYALLGKVFYFNFLLK
jgi:hypothetical protein